MAIGQIAANSSWPVMLYTVAVVLIVIWLLGLISDILAGGFIHVLLLTAVVMIVWQAMHGKRRLKIAKKWERR